MRGSLAAALGVAVAAAVAWFSVFYVQPRREARALHEDLRAARLAVDSCTMSLSQNEAEFRDYDDRVDSLLGRVRGLESLHPDGVPADSFDAYLEVFGRYNDAVPRWRARADSLQDRWTACRGLADRHNDLVDSMRVLLLEIGELPEGVSQPDTSLR